MLLYQLNPKQTSCQDFVHGIKSRSRTASLQSYMQAAHKEVTIQLRNHRHPQYAVILHFLHEYQPKDINQYRNKVHHYLSKAEIMFCETIEITTDGYGNPVNRVHFHFSVDTKLGINELRETFHAVCQVSGLIRHTNQTRGDYDIHISPIKRHSAYIRYKEKLARRGKKNSNRVILFAKGTGIKKTYACPGWFIDANGQRTTKKAIWKSYINEMKRKAQAANVISLPQIPNSQVRW